MLKTGIYKLKDLENRNLRSAKNRKRNIALDLYPYLSPSGAEAREIMLERLNLSNGSYRRTYPGRFIDFDSRLIEICREHLPTKENYQVHDIAISDGRTSCEFFDKLRKNLDSKIDFTGSDKDFQAFLYASIKNKGRKIITDEEGNILQFILPPFVLNTASPKNAKLFKLKNIILYPVNYLLLLLLKIKVIRRLLIPVKKEDYETINLLSPEALKHNEQFDNFCLEKYDLFREPTNTFDLIRVMNVINPSYFNEQDIQKISKNLTDSLKEAGILVVGSNQDAGSPVNGTVFQKEKGKLRVIEKFNQGAPFTDHFIS